MLGTRLAWLQLRTAAPGSKAEADAARRVAFALDRFGRDPAGAVQVLSWVVAHNDNRETRRELARVLVFTGACDAAVPVLQGLVDQWPESRDLASLGVCALLAGDLPGAERLADRSLSQAPSADGHFLRGNLYLEADRPGDALAEYDRALAIAPDHVDALRVSASVLCQVDPASARERLRRAAQLVPADAQRLLAGCPAPSPE